MSDEYPNITYKYVEGFPIPTYHCDECQTSTEGFSLCLKCNPQTYEVTDGGKPYNREQQEAEYMTVKPNSVGTTEPIQHTINALVEAEIANNVYAKEIWNAAIDTAASIYHEAQDTEFDIGKMIRKLKK